MYNHKIYSIRSIFLYPPCVEDYGKHKDIRNKLEVILVTLFADSKCNYLCKSYQVVVDGIHFRRIDLVLPFVMANEVGFTTRI